MLTDVQARRIASEWHGGGGTALYALASTGAIDTAEANHAEYGVAFEIEINLACAKHFEVDQNDDRCRELRDLAAYVRHHGRRGPVEGWGDLLW